jgi:hypothetical protein
MERLKDIEWFKSNVIPKIEGYELSYKFFDKGDFGSLNQLEFNSKKIGGNVDFWGLGWLGIFVWNYETEEQLLNVLLEPNQKKEQDEALKQLQDLL